MEGELILLGICDTAAAEVERLHYSFISGKESSLSVSRVQVTTIVYQRRRRYWYATEQLGKQKNMVNKRHLCR